MIPQNEDGRRTPTARFGRYSAGPRTSWKILKAASINACLAARMSPGADAGIAVVGASLSKEGTGWPSDRKKSLMIVAFAEICSAKSSRGDLEILPSFSRVMFPPEAFKIVEEEVSVVVMEDIMGQWIKPRYQTVSKRDRRLTIQSKLDIEWMISPRK